MKLLKTLTVLGALTLTLAATSAIAGEGAKGKGKGKGPKAVTVNEDVTTAYSLKKNAKVGEMITISSSNDEVTRIFPISIKIDGTELVKEIGTEGSWVVGKKIIDNPATALNEAQYFAPKVNATVWTKTGAAIPAGEYQIILTAEKGDQTITFNGPKIVVE